MGNSNSSNANQRPGRPTDVKQGIGSRPRSPSPAPGQPHSSMRAKKKSLELPGFSHLSHTPSQARGRQASPPKSAAINIPKTNNQSPPTRRAQNNFSSSELIAPATHLPFPPPRPIGSVSSYGRPYRARGPQPMQNIYEQSHHRPPTPPSPAPFVKEVVQSSIPSGLLAQSDIKPEEDDDAFAGGRVEDSIMSEPIAVRIIWRGGGRNVVLARAGDDDWNGRQPMERESPQSNTWHATVYLLPGTHHIRFLVDDQWRVADELPTAVDDQGSLANYVNVQPHSPPSQLSPLPSVSLPPPKPHQPGQSFWSAASSADDSNEDYRPSNDKSIVAQVIQAKWTSVLPLELIEAAREEEAYLTASAGQYDTNTRGVHVSGFVPAPNIPPAPGMPRHLDRLILNTKLTMPSQHGSGSSSTGSPSRPGSGLPGGVGSGQGGSSGRERGKREGRERRRREDRGTRESRREERERERREEQKERERREEKERKDQQPNWRDSGYANFPPAPPPSEDGSGAGLDEKPEHSPVRAGREEEVEQPTESVKTTITTPDSVPTPTQASESQPKPQTTAQQSGVPQRPGPSPLTTESRTPVSGSRAITLDMENMPAMSDDASVLPVPSHVVLQHLCTSAIRNGVLAVATTTRYRKKYMTTVYYKPT